LNVGMDKVLVVTGAGRGIGASIARLGAQSGYRVCVNYARNRAAAEAVVDEVASAGGRAIAVQADIAQESETGRLFETVDQELGRVTALVNNAGITGPLSPVDELPADRLQEVFGTNVYSLFYCCAQAVRRMSTRHGGRGGAIVNVGSIAARYGGMAGMVAYAASKGAVDSFTLGLAKEVGREGIRVNCVRPGTTRTDIIAPLGGEKLAAQVSAATPLGRLGEPDEIARAVLWLLSDDASFVHGALYDVSGGR
jgi:NAD(P)-dependent dehydrogenase (short-subunit alcohol dehydrogenase family)